MAKKDRLTSKLEQIRAMRQASATSKARISNPVTIIDVISSLQMERADDPTKSLDEDTIFQALAKAWKVSYKKIDPLKLDLNLVTTTI
ncbi:MAG: type II/IV secretion system protein, partial [Deltaproteobacteria bacterium]|nr:type II/IV secretion system protein [Deltaproteobacteria bacterium]